MKNEASMRTADLHSALKTTVVADLTESGIHYKHVRLQHGKDEFIDTLHAYPSSFSTAGIQATDFLHFLGFRRSPCAFHHGECSCQTLSLAHDVVSLTKALGSALQKFQHGARELASCGIYIGQPEGWSFFSGKPGGAQRYRIPRAYGDGHVAPQAQRLKESEDVFFRFVFTWIEGGNDKGWTTHYRAKHMPLSGEFQAALDFLEGFSWFPKCPEFDFEGCWWRFTPFQSDKDDVFNRNTEYAHGYFNAHATHFSPGLEQLLAAHVELEPHAMSFLSVRTLAAVSPTPAAPADPRPRSEPSPAPGRQYRYDVAISFAGTERPYAEELATRVHDAGFEVFYDGFYSEQLWGKDLASFFDRIYRKESRFCIMFVSGEYAERMWTNHERRSAQARALEERGSEYILPVRIDNTDLDGLPPSVGYVSLKQYSIEQIAGLLVEKLRSAKR
jgi:hypothetical protein